MSFLFKNSFVLYGTVIKVSDLMNANKWQTCVTSEVNQSIQVSLTVSCYAEWCTHVNWGLTNCTSLTPTELVEEANGLQGGCLLQKSWSLNQCRIKWRQSLSSFCSVRWRSESSKKEVSSVNVTSFEEGARARGCKGVCDFRHHAMGTFVGKVKWSLTVSNFIQKLTPLAKGA